MGNQQDVTVKLFEPIRLLSAVLAATDWPVKSQERQPHGTHAHARTTRKYLENFRDHPAVQDLQSLLDQGAPLEAMYTFILHLSWPELEMETLPRWVPPDWNDHLRDFYRSADLPKLWKDEGVLWKSCMTEAQKMFNGVGFKTFLHPFLGEISEELIFVPNISYPTDQEIGVRIGTQLLCIAPPRLAWGDSPPWPFDEDPTHVYRAALSQYGRLLLMAYLREHSEKVTEAATTPLPVSDQFRSRYPSWQEQFTALFVAAAVALYLESAVSKAEANAYVLMERKAHGMVILPGMISVLRRYLSELESGRYESLLDFLPVFPKQLRVAKKIVSL